MDNGRTPQTQSTAADISASTATATPSSPSPKPDRSAAATPDPFQQALRHRPSPAQLAKAQARVARLRDRKVLALAGAAFADYPPAELVPVLREQLVQTIAQFGESTYTRKQAAAHAAGQVAALVFAGAPRIIAEVQTCPVTSRIGWVGGARMASIEPTLQGDTVTSWAVVALSNIAAMRAAERLKVLHPTAAVGCGVAATIACVRLAHWTRLDLDEIRLRVIELADRVLDESSGLMLGIYSSLQARNTLNPTTIEHFAATTSAARLDPRDTVAAWFTQGSA